MDSVRPRLNQIRDLLLPLHKALLDAEKASYEREHGLIESPGAYLQLLIGDKRFAWLRPITTLIVSIDEGLDKKNPPATGTELAALIEETKLLLTTGAAAGDDFLRPYNAAIGTNGNAGEILYELALLLAE